MVVGALNCWIGHTFFGSVCMPAGLQYALGILKITGKTGISRDSNGGLLLLISVDDVQNFLPAR